MKHRLFAMITVLILTSTIMWPLARADDVHINLAFAALPANATQYDKLANLANVSDQQFSNYNKTWLPFFSDNPDIVGVTATPLTLPAIIQQPSSTLQAVQRVKFGADQIMSGSSVSWWRSPIGNYTSATLVGMKIYRSDSASLNVTSISASGPVFNDPSQATLVWNYSGHPLTARPFIARGQQVPITVLGPPQWFDLTPAVNSTMIQEANPLTNYAGLGGMWAQQSSVANRTRILIDWNVAPYISGQILGATLNLTIDASTVGQLGVWSAQPGWTAGTVSWSNQPATGSGEWQSIPVINRTHPANVKVTINVTRELQNDWHFGTHGLLLMMDNENLPPAWCGTTCPFQFTAYSTPYGNPAFRPTLRVLARLPLTAYKFAYVAVRAPIFSQKNYYAYWELSGAGPLKYHLYYSEGDLGQDGVFTSWLRVDNGSTTFIPADLDQSVVFTFGMANGLAGLIPTCSYYGVTCTFVRGINWSFPASTVIGGALTPTFLNALFPVRVLNVDAPAIDLWVFATLVTTGGSVITPTRLLKLNGTSALAYATWNITALFPALVGATITRVFMAIPFINQQTRVWIAAKDNPTITQLSMCNAVNNCNNITFWFAPYGYFSVDPFFFLNTELKINLIPVQEPATPLGKVQLYQEWTAAMTGGTNCTAVLASRTWSYILTAGAKALFDFLSGDQCTVSAVITGASFALHAIFGVLTAYFGPVVNWLYKIGIWIWQAIQFVIHAIEWFLFWAVKFINVFIVASIFAIMYFSSTYVMRGFYVWAKTGFDTEEMRDVFKEGWDKVWSIIALILSMVMVAVGAIQAVKP